MLLIIYIYILIYKKKKIKYFLALENSIYTWSAKTTEAVKLAEYTQSTVTSLNWHP